MAHRVVVELDLAFGERLHQVDPPTWRIHLGPRQHVGRARLEAEPAMDAVEQQLVIDDIAHGPCSGGRLAARRHCISSVFSGHRKKLLLSGHRKKSESSDETPRVEDARGIERRFHSPHQVKRPRRRLSEEIQFVASSGRYGEDAQMSLCAVRRLTPSFGLPIYLFNHTPTTEKHL